MKPILIAGIGLILLGIVAFSYNRITYTTKEKIVDIGPIEATADKEKTIRLPPLLGGLALIAGVGLIGSVTRNNLDGPCGDAQITGE